MPKMKVVSDGTPQNTKIYYGDEDITDDIKCKSISIQVTLEGIEASFTIQNPELEMKLADDVNIKVVDRA